MTEKSDIIIRFKEKQLLKEKKKKIALKHLVTIWLRSAL